MKRFALTMDIIDLTNNEKSLKDKGIIINKVNNNTIDIKLKDGTEYEMNTDGIQYYFEFISYILHVNTEHTLELIRSDMYEINSKYSKILGNM